MKYTAIFIITVKKSAHELSQSLKPGLMVCPTPQHLPQGLPSSAWNTRTVVKLRDVPNTVRPVTRLEGEDTAPPRGAAEHASGLLMCSPMGNCTR